MIPQLFSSCGDTDTFCRLGIGLGIFAAFVAFWLGMMFLVAVMSGWRVLAEKYGLPEGERMPEGTTIKWRSAALWGRFPTNYKSCLNFTATPLGLGIVPVLLFSTGHPPLFIPWSDITLEEKKVLFSKRLKMTIESTGYSFSVWGEKDAHFIRSAKQAA